MTIRSVAVVGAGLAGLGTARALREQGFDGRLSIIGAERHRPYDRPPLSKDFLAGKSEEVDLALELPGADLDADWLLGRAATELSTSDGSVLLDDGTRVRTDAVVIATGARASHLPGRRPGGVHVLRTLDDARALRAELATAHRLVVVGAGFIGAEVAATARGLGLAVTVVEAAASPLSGPLGTEMGAAVAALHEDHGVRLRCGTGVAELTGGARVDGVRLADGTHVPADVVVVGVGARPCVEWLAGSPVPVGDGVLCDASGGTGVPGVIAVGDAAAWYEPALGRHQRIEHWTAAATRPRLAVGALLSGRPAAPDRAPYFWSDQYGRHIQFAGHALPGDEVTVEDGSVAEHGFLAVYRRAGEPVAVLGVDRVRLFTQWRRRLDTTRRNP